MKKIIWITGILLLFVILKSKSCSKPDEGTEQQNTVDKWRNEIKMQFGTAELDTLLLEEFEKAAKQKLIDFYDYLRILSDPVFRKPYREKAGEMILQMFISDTVRIRIKPHNQRPVCETSISQLVQTGMNTEIPLSLFVCDSVQVLRHFKRTAVDVYSAEFSFIERRSSGMENADHGPPGKKIALVYLLKRNIIFPTDTLSLWHVYLGGIQELCSHLQEDMINATTGTTNKKILTQKTDEYEKEPDSKDILPCFPCNCTSDSYFAGSFNRDGTRSGCF